MSRFLKQRPVKSGLYDPEFEKDSCGVGLVANIKGVPSREIMENAYLINSEWIIEAGVVLRKILGMEQVS